MKTFITVEMPHGSHRREVEVKPKGQKFAVGERVYILPISDKSKLHFNCDMITTIKHSYNQAFGNGGASSQYATKVASWYSEHELMSAGDMTIEQCRDKLADEFGASYHEMNSARKLAISDGNLVSDAINRKIAESIRAEFAEFMARK